MPEAVLYPIVVLAIAAFMLWFALGTRANIAKGNRVLEWFQTALPRLGPRTKLRWLGSSAVQLDIADAQAPFAEAQVVVVLEPRDLSWLWAWSRARGRRDFIILRGRLRSAPRFELEAGTAQGWTGRHGLDRLDPATWTATTWADDVEVRHSTDADQGRARATWDGLRAGGIDPWRISIRREHPHVQLHVALPDTEAVPARALIDSFIDLGSSVIRKG